MTVKKRIPKCAAMLMLLMVPCFVQAQQSGSDGLLPEGQTLLSLSLTERRDVVPDRLVASLRVEHEDRDPVAVQQHINTRMDEALRRIDPLDDVVAGTGRYSVYQYQRQPGNGRGDSVWRGSQTVTLETDTAYEQVQALAGELQTSGFVMNRLEWQLSNARADRIRDDMLERAIERARSRAQRAGEALGRGDVEIAEITVSAESSGRAPVEMRSMAMDAAGSAAPESRPGETEVTLTIGIRAVAR